MESAGDAPLLFLQDVHYVSHKGYRIIRPAESIQIYDDFSSNDLLEVQAFIGMLFKMHLSLEEIKYWDQIPWDRYGLLARIAEEFTIEGDHNDLIFNSTLLTDQR